MRPLLYLIIVVAISQTSIAQQGATPNFKAPPGYTTKVESVHETFNFYGLTRTIPLPWERLLLPESQVPKGTSISNNFKCPSKIGEKLYNDPASTLSTFGTPSRQRFQSFVGKDGEGVIMYFEYAKVLPSDAKERLSKLFFKSGTPPDPNTSKAMEQFLVNDHTIIVWCFKSLKSKVKEMHQKQIFNLISEVAMELEKNKKK